MIRKFILAALLLAAPSVWAQGTISAMTAASALSGTELFECVQSGSKKCTATQIKTFTSASPTLVTPNIGTPSAGVLTNATGYTVGALSGAGTGVLTALGVNVGSAGAPVLFNGAGGTPSSITLTNAGGTAASLTAGTVTTNANLTGDVTSSGNATTLATVNSNVGSFTNASITVNAKGLITAASTGSGGAGTVTATGGNLTANAVVLGAGTTDTKVVAGIVTDGVGALTLTSTVNATSADGLLLQNTTAAAAGAQQWSPRLHFKGQGWKTTSTAASQAVDWTVETVPVEGTTAPTSNLVFSSSINGGAYTGRLTVNSAGQTLSGLDGTASVVSFGRAAAVNTGMYFPGTNQVAFAANGVVGLSLSSSTITIPSTFTLNWNSDVFISRGAAAATLQQGAANAASPVAQTLQAQGSRSGTDSNVGGANFTVRAGTGTGTGTLSSLILQSPIAVASGTGAQTNTTGLTIHNGTFVSVGYTVATLPAAPSNGARAHVTDATACVFATAPTGGGAVICPVYWDGAWKGG